MSPLYLLDDGRAHLLLTTVNQSILSCRVCVIVNDMASLNIDAALIKNTKLIQTEERMVELQNGCICCTLREDLLHEVGNLATSGKFEYLVIESTGISEPMHVAETFTMNVDGEEGGVIQPLYELATLDTCVTVVDAANLLMNAYVCLFVCLV
jgi:G3E family GTPase